MAARKSRKKWNEISLLCESNIESSELFNIINNKLKDSKYEIIGPLDMDSHCLIKHYDIKYLGIYIAGIDIINKIDEIIYKRRNIQKKIEDQYHIKIWARNENTKSSLVEYFSNINGLKKISEAGKRVI
ncbi:MAG: hypothetical protein AABW65_00090 [Nanoarchaeota archaeon]